jgi:hypothetical protein
VIYKQGRLFTAVALVALVGCTSTEEVMKSWMGSRESEVVSRWGAPDRVIDTRDGLRVLTWDQRWGQYGQNTCSKSFTVDSGGIIHRWAYRGCPF